VQAKAMSKPVVFIRVLPGVSCCARRLSTILALATHARTRPLRLPNLADLLQVGTEEEHVWCRVISLPLRCGPHSGKDKRVPRADPGRNASVIEGMCAEFGAYHLLLAASRDVGGKREGLNTGEISWRKGNF